MEFRRSISQKNALDSEARYSAESQTNQTQTASVIESVEIDDLTKSEIRVSSGGRMLASKDPLDSQVKDTKEASIKPED
jgi:hypothetical protein